MEGTDDVDQFASDQIVCVRINQLIDKDFFVEFSVSFVAEHNRIKNTGKNDMLLQRILDQIGDLVIDAFFDILYKLRENDCQNIIFLEVIVYQTDGNFRIVRDFFDRCIFVTVFVKHLFRGLENSFPGLNSFLISCHCFTYFF
jgi:hypothetical protein